MVPDVMVAHDLPVGYDVVRNVDVPAQIVKGMSTKEKAMKKAGLSLGRRVGFRY